MTVPREERTRLLRRNTRATYHFTSGNVEERQKNTDGFAGSNKEEKRGRTGGEIEEASEEEVEADGDEHIDIVKPENSSEANDGNRGQEVNLPDFSTLLSSLCVKTYTPSDDYLAISRSSPALPPYNWPNKTLPIPTKSNYYSNQPVWQAFDTPSSQYGYGSG
ncbi:hypothetical protein LTS18_005078 [Coniosporium uncinatum]|uniref:Uncharacterized protein n=1 Tax=Coniosporium uncinatum TaxID=93489 RepID=A0ACC3DS31_9PEZI|nr:hypothetical protein LTS18_005078 [Coniosporium uncinatum]